MDFITAVKTVFSKYADFTGRAPRSEFWWWTLFNIIVSLVLTLLLGETLSSVWSLAVLIPSLAVGARRLHDIGKSGWWQFLVLIPLIGALVLIWWFATKGDESNNAHGANPLG